MMAVYSHVPKEAVDEAATALDPDAAPGTVPPNAPHAQHVPEGDMSRVASQQGSPRRNVKATAGNLRE